MVEGRNLPEGSRMRTSGNQQEQVQRRAVSRRMEEAYEDIRIFEEWLHESHHTVIRSRILFKGRSMQL